MKESKVFNSGKIVQDYIDSEAKKHPFCMVVWYPEHALLTGDLNDLLGTNIPREDEHIAVIPYSSLTELKEAAKKVSGLDFHGDSIVFYKKGKTFTP